MLETVILGGGVTEIDIPGLKAAVTAAAKEVKKEEDFDKVEADLLKKFTIKPKEVPVAPTTPDANAAAPTEEKDAKS